MSGRHRVNPAQAVLGVQVLPVCHPQQVSVTCAKANICTSIYVEMYSRYVQYYTATFKIFLYLVNLLAKMSQNSKKNKVKYFLKL